MKAHLIRGFLDRGTVGWPALAVGATSGSPCRRATAGRPSAGRSSTSSTPARCASYDEQRRDWLGGRGHLLGAPAQSRVRRGDHEPLQLQPRRTGARSTASPASDIRRCSVRTTSFAAAQTYEFLSNAWFTPYVGGGVEVSRVARDSAFQAFSLARADGPRIPTPAGIAPTWIRPDRAAARRRRLQGVPVPEGVLQNRFAGSRSNHGSSIS